MQIKTQLTERGLLIAVVILIAVAILGPGVMQPTHQHDFADQRFWGYLPYAADVLSNLPFALWGFAGCLMLPRIKQRGATISLAMLFFAGLMVTAGASIWYHLQPNDAGLMVDRLGMSVAFAGLLGLAAADRVSPSAGVLLGILALVFGPFSVWGWSMTGNVLPWLVFQFGGMTLILWLAACPPVPSKHGGLAVRWGLVIAIYAAAKILELADHAVYDLTAQIVSGHSLKHIVASFAAWPVISALRTQVIFKNNRAV